MSTAALVIEKNQRVNTSFIKSFFFALPTFFLMQNIQAQSLNVKQVAIHGYDVVAYHRGQALQGTDRLSAQVGETHYYFTSEENRKLFEANPTKYLPKFGGYCAIGIAIYDGKYDIDPEDFLIDDGELYLFCPDQIDNWKADQANLKKKAETEWLRLKDSPAKH